MDPTVLLAAISGTRTGTSGVCAGPFIVALHVAFAAGVVASAVGAVVSLMHDGHGSWEPELVAPGRLAGT